MSGAKQNPAWDHGTLIRGTKGHVRCNHCRQTMKGIRQLKDHLAAEKNARGSCSRCPSSVRVAMLKNMIDMQAINEQKAKERRLSLERRKDLAESSTGNDFAQPGDVRYLAQFVIEDEEANRDLLLSLSEGETDSDYKYYLEEIRRIKEGGQVPGGKSDLDDDLTFPYYDVGEGSTVCNDGDEDATDDTDEDWNPGPNQ
ncbi:putative Zinc finger, BED-type [Corchorus capsularis]|uniref:Putative Zinc finger, BED-type n=1 Tax=Corchorus capsularis TaxID=210143 RepID=A0A1R3JT40_COCAP|nr:putative Zinc finger, BED-type [Corchorus capsularis]